MTKAEEISKSLQQRIDFGEWSQGQKLPSEGSLCREYGASRITVRSALNMLAAQGQVATFKGKGSFVRGKTETAENHLTQFHASRIDMFEFRRILEGEIAFLSAQRADQDTIRQLQRSALNMQTARDQSQIAYYDEEFHTILAHSTKNDVIIQIFNLMRGEFRKMFRENVAAIGADGFEAHLRIVAAIESREGSLARQYMHEHLNSTMEKTSMLNTSGDLLSRQLY